MMDILVGVPVICDGYAINYPEKIRVYHHKQNGGLSDARIMQ